MRMRINKLLGTALIPGTENEMRFHQRGEDIYTIEVMGNHGDLMTTAVHASEDALARLTLERMPRKVDMQVLVGGLGMGFTLAEALRGVGPEATVTVAELVPEVVEWNKGPMGRCAGEPLNDPRTQVYVGDVVELLRSKKAQFDVVLLDTDNGPEAFTRAANARLYSLRGLERIWNALKPGGMLAVWSAHTDPVFTDRLERMGFKVEKRSVFAEEGDRGTRHYLWFAKRR